MTDVLQVPVSIGPYSPLEILGSGGMGVVYRARHRETGQLVALKSLRVPQQGTLAGIRREIHALSKIRHPGIIRIFEQGVEQGVPWYAMELIQGTPMHRHCAELAAGAASPAGEAPVAGQTPRAPVGSQPVPTRVPTASADSQRADSGATHELLDSSSL